MYCSKCGNEIPEDSKFCPKCGNQIVVAEDKTDSSNKDKIIKEYSVQDTENEEKINPLAGKVSVEIEEKDYESLEDILKEYIPLCILENGSKKQKKASKFITKNKAKPEEILALIDESLLRNGIKGFAFTKDAIYEKLNFFNPLVIKYCDIEDVWLENFMGSTSCVVKTNTGLLWEIAKDSSGKTTTNIQDFNGIAELIAQIVVFSKKHPVQSREDLKTSTSEDNTYNVKGALIISIATSVIFAWNSYAIVHNFSVRDGYLFAIIGIVVNLGILFGWDASIVCLFKRIFKNKLKKIHKYSGYIYFAILFLIFGLIIGHVPYKKLLAESAKPLVSQIIKNAYGDYMDVAKCARVDDVYKITDHIYKATAYLDNGNKLSITISDADKGNIYVELDN